VIPHNRPTLGEPELAAARRVIAGGWVAQGPEVEALEAEVCAYLGVADAQAVAFSSGSAALFVALWALGARGKRVAIPAYSCAAVGHAVVLAGGQPVPFDVAEDSPNIDLAGVARADVALIIAAHIFGIPDRWHEGLAARSTPIIEDCAQAFGARIDGSPVGLNGDIGIFSFYATKMLTAGGQGGMLVSRDSALAEAARDYRQFDGRHDRRPRFNLQMSDLQAAIARAQLAQLQSFLARRRMIRERYDAAGLPLWPPVPAGIEPCHYRAILRTQDPARMLSDLAGQGVRGIVPIADWELLGEPESFPRAARLARSTVSLPMFPTLTPPETARVISAVQRGLALP
jgi:perosamine synthetase